ncbi:hypothetical protein GCM10029992_21750 [Glycomyces albus]
MTRRQRTPLEPSRVYDEFVNAGGHRMAVHLHHDEGPQIALVCWPLHPEDRMIRWQGRLWSSNPAEWKQEVKRLAFAAIDASCARPGVIGRKAVGS